MAPVVQSCCLIWCRLVRSRDFSAPKRITIFERACTSLTTLRIERNARFTSRRVVQFLINRDNVQDAPLYKTTARVPDFPCKRRSDINMSLHDIRTASGFYHRLHLHSKLTVAIATYYRHLTHDTDRLIGKI